MITPQWPAIPEVPGLNVDNIRATGNSASPNIQGVKHRSAVNWIGRTLPPRASVSTRARERRAGRWLARRVLPAISIFPPSIAILLRQQHRPVCLSGCPATATGRGEAAHSWLLVMMGSSAHMPPFVRACEHQSARAPPRGQRAAWSRGVQRCGCLTRQFGRAVRNGATTSTALPFAPTKGSCDDQARRPGRPVRKADRLSLHRYGQSTERGVVFLRAASGKD